MKGSRIYSIVKELRNENIDVVNYTANPSLMIQRSLNPAKVSSITIDEGKMTASVYLKPDQVSLAIGKGRSQHPPLEDAHRLRHRRLPRNRRRRTWR